MLKRREMAEVYHTSHGHCNNRQTVSNLQAKGIECNHSKRYILAHKCDACDAAPGRRHHKVRTTTKAKRKAKSASNTIAPLPATVAACDLQNSLADDCDLDLEFSTITDAFSTITDAIEFQSIKVSHALLCLLLVPLSLTCQFMLNVQRNRYTPGNSESVCTSARAPATSRVHARRARRQANRSLCASL